MGAVSRTTGGRNDHWFWIMLGGVGPESVGRPPAMSSANLRNSCTHHNYVIKPMCYIMPTHTQSAVGCWYGAEELG